MANDNKHPREPGEIGDPHHGLPGPAVPLPAGDADRDEPRDESDD